MEVACWAHARRKFFDAQDTDQVRGRAALAFIHRLYQVETLAKGMKAKERQALRQKEALPVLRAFREWMDAQVLLLPKSAMGLAFQYALRQWPSAGRTGCSRAAMRAGPGRRSFIPWWPRAGGTTSTPMPT